MPLLGTDAFAGNADSRITTAIARSDMVFHIFKATEGKTFKDADYLRNRQWAKDAGDVAGAYAFCWLSNSGVDEAKFFLDTAQPEPGQLIAGDWEDWGTTLPDKGVALRGATPWRQRWQHAMDFTQTILDETKTRPLCYINWDYLKNFRGVATVTEWEWWIDNPLWLAQWFYGGAPAKPGQFDYAAPKSGGSKEWHPTFHQYVSGTTSASGLDEDWFVGDRPALQSFTIQEETLSSAEYTALSAAITKLTNMVEQKANIVDVKAVTAAVESLASAVGGNQTNLMNKLSELLSTVGINEAEVMGALEQVEAGVNTTVSETIKQSLNSSLGGIEMTARYVRKD